MSAGGTGWSRRGFLAAAGTAAALLPLAAPARAARPAPAVFRRGISTWPWFSLTTEYPAPRTDYAWPPFQADRPVPTSADLMALRSAGFDFIRLPVDPGPFLAFSGCRRAALLAELFDAVRLALSADLGVIVNLQANAATHYWRPERMFASVDAPAFDAFRRLVGDLAAGLAGFPQDRVALEPVNEPFQACGAREWQAVQRSLVRTSRGAAPDLTYVATGACGSMVSGFAEGQPQAATDGGPMLFTFHFYEPYLFTHQGAPWMSEPVYRALNAVPWPGSAGTLEGTLAAVRRQMKTDRDTSAAEKASTYSETETVLRQYFEAQPDRGFIDGFFADMRAFADRNAIPRDQVLLGEFGALKSGGRYVAADPDDRARYVGDVRRAAEESGFGWAFWNLFDGLGMMDETTRQLDHAITSALGLAAPG